MPAVFSRFGHLLLLVGLLAPSTASAWTRTEVRGMRARAEVMPSGFARVGLEITVEVQGGWVERFEIAGLGQGAKLDELKPPTWIKASAALDDTDATAGTKYVPAIKLRDDGTLSLDFGGRATAPRRGTFHSRIVYETRLINDGRGALVLSLPSWSSALENVELWIDAPRGTAHLPASESDLDAARVLERGALTTLYIVKPQLPRIHPLEARLLLPNMAAAPAPAAVPAADDLAADERPSRQAWGVALLLLALIVLKRRAFAAPSRSDERLFSSAKAVMVALTACAFPYAHAWSTAAGAIVLVALVALGLALPTTLHTEALDPGLRYRPAQRIDALRARRARLAGWLGPRSWVDASTPSGFSLLFMLGALALLASLAIDRAGAPQDALFLSAWAAALPLFVVRTRLARKRDANDALLALAGIQSELTAIARQHGANAALEVACASSCGPALHTRLRFFTREAAASSAELSLVLAEDGDGRSMLAWLTTSDERTTLRKAGEPKLELAALLSPVSPPAAPLANAA